MGKKGYFFTVDAFLASGVIVVAILILFSYNSQTSPSLQAELYSEEVASILAKTRIYEMNNEFIDILKANKTITNADNTILEQVGEFYAGNNIEQARLLIENVTKGMVQLKYEIRILVDNTTIYLTNHTKIPENQARTLSTTKKIVSGVFNQSTIWGPYIAEVRVWQS